MSDQSSRIPATRRSGLSCGDLTALSPQLEVRWHPWGLRRDAEAGSQSQGLSSLESTSPPSSVLWLRPASHPGRNEESQHRLPPLCPRLFSSPLLLHHRILAEDGVGGGQVAESADLTGYCGSATVLVFKSFPSAFGILRNR